MLHVLLHVVAQTNLVTFNYCIKDVRVSFAKCTEVLRTGTSQFIIALDKALFSTKKYLYFSYFSTKTYVVGTH